MIITKSIVKYVRSLKEKSTRRAERCFIAEGLNLIKDIKVPAKMLITLDESVISKLSCVPEVTYIADETQMKMMSDTVTPQGVIGVYPIEDNMDIVPPSGMTVVLDGVTDPGNVGTIMRTCSAIGYNDVYLCDCVDPYSPKVVRSSMGGIFNVRVHEGSEEEVLSCLKDNGYTICALDMGGENIFNCTFGDKIAVVVGSEAHGVSSIMREGADRILSLPMDGNMESLNAALACGISMYLIRYNK